MKLFHSSKPYSAVIVFGPNHAKAAADLRAQGVTNIVETDDIETLKVPDAHSDNLTLVFAHRIPDGHAIARGWEQEVLARTSLDWVEMGRPEIQVLVNEQDSDALIMLHWTDVNARKCIAVAREIGRSYSTLAAAELLAVG
ncbi:MAG: hypothetical protein ACXWZ1_10810 [Gaiellaceae bacterium]